MNFPALENKIYFDTARSGLMYDELLRWRKDHEHLFLIKGSQIDIIDNCGHMMLLEEADRVLNVLKKFITTNYPANK